MRGSFMERWIVRGNKNRQETRRTPESPPEAYFYAFTGVTTEQHAADPIAFGARDVMQEQFGPNVHAEAFPSIVSSDALKKDRVVEMADKIEEAFTSGKETTMVLYSMGASEFCRAFLLMLERREQRRQQTHGKFEALNLEKVHFVFRSPAGITPDWGSRWRQFWNTINLARSSGIRPYHFHPKLRETINRGYSAPDHPDAVAAFYGIDTATTAAPEDKIGQYYGLDLLATIPPKDENGQFVPEIITRAVARAYPHVLFARDLTPEELEDPAKAIARKLGAEVDSENSYTQPLRSDTRKDYLVELEYEEMIDLRLQIIDAEQAMSPNRAKIAQLRKKFDDTTKKHAEIHQRLQELDLEMLRAAQELEEGLDHATGEERENLIHNFQKAFKSRTDYLIGTNLLADILANKNKVLTGNEWKKKSIKSSLFSLLHLFPTLGRAFAGNNMEIFKFLQNRGASFELQVPMMDIFLKADDVTEFFTLKESERNRHDRLKLGAVTVLETTTHSMFPTLSRESAEATRQAKGIIQQTRSRLLGK